MGHCPAFKLLRCQDALEKKKTNILYRWNVAFPHHMISNLGYRYKGIRSDRWALVNSSQLTLLGEQVENIKKKRGTPKGDECWGMYSYKAKIHTKGKIKSLTQRTKPVSRMPLLEKTLVSEDKLMAQKTKSFNTPRSYQGCICSEKEGQAESF